MHTLQQIILEKVCPGVLISTKEQMPALLEEVKAQKLAITAGLKVLADDEETKERITKDVQECQFQMILWLEILHKYQQHSDHSLIAFYQELEEMLQGILMGLEQHFSEYLAIDYQLPQSYVVIVSRQMEERIAEMKVFLRKRNVEEPLLDVMFNPILNHKGNLSFRMVMYYRRLLFLLNDHGSLSNEEYIDQLHYILYEYNFNSPEYFIYCTTQMRRKLKAFRTIREKRACLSWYEKELRSLPEREVVLNEMQSSIRSRMFNWLKDEKQYVQSLLSTSQV
ncbi:hypothetical protein GFS24_22880 [Chitinophaga sp. SYP-B3965]|uniref:hypothetical protein n=1 Tax=Chitinophaga sp. SYP-B3965 TaxID=2663120 RepID=UPI00129A08C9|nr:hypothetical protein [Chitinophaga sp. SYP-B3965]MRG47983.1 hypothetical protein [Chitinophaga sp. SYP-B3965]